MDELNEWLRRADEANLLTVKEQKNVKEAITTLDLTPLTQYAIADLCDAIYKLGQLANSDIKPVPDKLLEETKKWLDKQTAEERLAIIKDICVDWDGYRTADGLGSLINEIWAYATYPCNNKAQEIIQFKSKNDNDVAQFNKEEIAAPVVHGRWIEIETEDAYDFAGIKTWALKARCSECDFVMKFIEAHTGQYIYCPHCGTQMDGGEDK